MEHNVDFRSHSLPDVVRAGLGEGVGQLAKALANEWASDGSPDHVVRELFFGFY